MKTKEELNTLKEEFKTVNKKLAELTEEELAQVSGRGDDIYCPKCGRMMMVTGRCSFCSRKTIVD